MATSFLRSFGHALRRARLWVVSAGAVAALGVCAGTAHAGCYFAAGCAWGSLSPNSPTPWTGWYSTDRDWMALWGDEPYPTMTIDLHSGGYYHKTATGAGMTYPHTYGSFQHRCWQSSTQTRQFQCGFN